MHNPTGRKAKTTESLSQLIAVAVEQHALEVGKLLNSLSCSGTGLPLKKSVPLRAWEGNIGENKDTNVTKALSILVSPLEQWAEDWNAPLCSWAPHSPGWLRWELKVRWKFLSLCAFAPPSPTQKCFSRVLLPYSCLLCSPGWRDVLMFFTESVEMLPIISWVMWGQLEPSPCHRPFWFSVVLLFLVVREVREVMGGGRPGCAHILPLHSPYCWGSSGLVPPRLQASLWIPAGRNSGGSNSRTSHLKGKSGFTATAVVSQLLREGVYQKLPSLNVVVGSVLDLRFVPKLRFVLFSLALLHFWPFLTLGQGKWDRELLPLPPTCSLCPSSHPTPLFWSPILLHCI